MHSDYLLSLINQVLHFARIEAGRLEVRLEPVSVPEVMNEIGVLVAPQVKAKGLHLFYCECSPLVYVMADRDKLDQILLNLVTNATKFTQPGGSIRLECESNRTAVRLTVRDTGRGIPAAQLENIFAPFVQLNGDRSRVAGSGVGLGLAISRELALAMHGELTVQNVVGAGSTFTLQLPRGYAGGYADEVGERRLSHLLHPDLKR